MRALSLVWAAALCVVPAQEKPPESLLPGPQWIQWKDLTPGSSLTMELETGGKKYRKSVILKEKTAVQLTFEEVVEADGARRPAAELVVTKPEGSAGLYDTIGIGECKDCKKAQKDHKRPEYTQSLEKSKIAAAEIECRTSTSVSYDCEGKESSRTTFSRSPDVPGNLVRLEVKDKTREYKIVCVGFEKK
jgi:hypothetical protein